MPERNIDEIERRDRERHKELLKEALAEYIQQSGAEGRKLVAEAVQGWLDKQYQEIGKWTVRGMGAMLFGALVYWIAMHGGKP